MSICTESQNGVFFGAAALAGHSGGRPRPCSTTVDNRQLHLHTREHKQENLLCRTTFLTSPERQTLAVNSVQCRWEAIVWGPFRQTSTFLYSRHNTKCPYRVRHAKNTVCSKSMWSKDSFWRIICFGEVVASQIVTFWLIFNYFKRFSIKESSKT